ncbi:uncharacterized protein [Pseudochaenichthys georgianus]|uniref:uncharacterized protein isoform X2 n=1 Tax=Pseudochaenichthys georgianus TaxID=52239 RepID=UPI00146B0466|nr:uncharacterized protein LOC117442761 isoform X2 [Pseudochaenichthys georgianus]
MSGFRRIVMSSFLMLLLHFPDSNQYFPIVRAGDEVTLPCANEIEGRDECGGTTWLFRDSKLPAAVTLFEGRQIQNEAKAKSDGLRVTEKCALVIKKVTEEDAGGYTCSQFRSGTYLSDSHVDLSVVTMTEQQDNDEVTLDCSVSHVRCRHSVKWLLQGRDVDKDHREIKTSASLCSASVTFLTSLFSYASRSELFTCEVTDGDTREVQVFPFSPQSSGEDKKPATTKTTTATTTTTTTTAAAKINKKPGEDAGKVTTVSTTWTAVRMRAAGETTNTAPEDNQTEREDNNKGRLRLIIVSVGLAALIITVVTVNIWTRAKGSKAQTEENMIDEDEDEVDYENDGEASASV